MTSSKRPVPDVTNLRYVVRYFHVVAPVPALMTAALAVVTVTGAVGLLVAPASDRAVALPLLVLQAFSASTGFSGPARRGHFDLLLTRGESRVRIALVQWLTAVAPGALSWGLLVAIAGLRAGGAADALLASGTLLAMLVVSTVPWACTVGLPRFSGAIGWLLLISLAPVSNVAWPDAIRLVVVPTELAGRHPVSLGVAGTAMALALGSMVTAMVWVHRTDIPLEAAQ